MEEVYTLKRQDLLKKSQEYREQAIAKPYSKELSVSMLAKLPKWKKPSYVSQKPILEKLLPVQLFRSKFLKQNKFKAGKV
ncbi:MAG: hypothetical protein ACI9QC_000746 [Oceanicoccus sp.]|jgi:hypothetical protein